MENKETSLEVVENKSAITTQSGNTAIESQSSFTNMANIIKAEVDSQILTAKSFPRNVVNFLHQAKTLSCLDVETAESCIYSLPRAGKNLRGASVRLAEIVASTYGNLRVGSQIISNDGKKITSRAYAHDLESNLFVSVELTGKITDKTGKVYSEDMQTVASNALNSKTFRNAIFKVVPMAFTKGIMKQVEKVIIGNVKDISTRRDEAIKYFEKLGVKSQRVFEILEVTGIEAIGEEELLTLIGFVNAIKNNEATIEDCFPVVKPESDKSKKAEENIINELDKETKKK